MNGRAALGTVIAQDAISIENFARIAHLDPGGDILDRRIAVKRQGMAMIKEGLRAKPFNPGQAVADPEAGQSGKGFGFQGKTTDR